MDFNQDYLYEFKGAYVDEHNIHYVAFQTALQTRQFEIELYWKRANYFWAFIAASFAGYFVMSDKGTSAGVYPFVISCLGFFFTLAFFLVNKGSKFWQENWENHVAVLGKLVVGPLFSITLSRPSEKKTAWHWITVPIGISVSKVNQWVSFFLLVVWVFLMFASSHAGGNCIFDWLRAHPYLGVFLFTLLTMGLMFTRIATDYGPHRPERRRIETSISQ